MGLHVALASLLVAAAASFAGAALAGAPCGQATRGPAKGSVADWVEAKRPLYVFDRRGRLHLAGFDQRPWRLLSDHGFSKYGPSVQFSADHRWMIYFGSRESGPTQFWLYDTQLGRDTLVLERARVNSIPTFSPDQRRVAWFAFDPPEERGIVDRVASLFSDSRSGIYLLDAATGKTTLLRVPASSRLDVDHSYGSVRWSDDGRELFARLGDADLEEYYRVSVATGAYTRVEGHYDSEREVLVIASPGGSIELPRPPLAAGNNARMRRWYPERGYGRAAEFDAEKVLRVADEQGRMQVVARGDASNPCGSGIHGWLEGDRYLLYLLDENSYIHDTATGRSAPLFAKDQAAQVRDFYW